MKKAVPITLLTPSPKLVDSYLERFKTNEYYNSVDKAITHLFKKLPENKKMEDVLIKVSVINDLYTSNVYDPTILAKHILGLHIDEGLALGEPSIVNCIAIGHGISKSKTEGDKNYYSFASKYCGLHNQEEYPMYDNYIHKILVAYQRKSKFSNFEPEDLKSFSKFKKVLQDFKTKYSLTKYNVKEIDMFLWIYGHDLFPVRQNKWEMKSL